MTGAWLRQEHANLSSSANNFFRLPCRSVFFCRVACAPFGQAGASSCTSQRQRYIAILTTMCKLCRLISHGGGNDQVKIKPCMSSQCWHAVFLFARKPLPSNPALCGAFFFNDPVYAACTHQLHRAPQSFCTSLARSF